MTEEAKWAVDILINAAGYQWCSECAFKSVGLDACSPECSYLRIAMLIKSLSTELEQVKKERDAAVEQMSEYCEFCVRYGWKVDELCYNCKMHVLPFDDNEGERENYWQWRGVKMDEEV